MKQDKGRSLTSCDVVDPNTVDSVPAIFNRRPGVDECFYHRFMVFLLGLAEVESSVVIFHNIRIFGCATPH